jgi:hypothetical protein
MPAVPIKSREQYIKAIEVLDRVGGTWHGVGDEERYLLVTPAVQGPGGGQRRHPRRHQGGLEAWQELAPGHQALRRCCGG